MAVVKFIVSEQKIYWKKKSIDDEKEKDKVCTMHVFTTIFLCSCSIRPSIVLSEIHQNTWSLTSYLWITLEKE